MQMSFALLFMKISLVARFSLPKKVLNKIVSLHPFAAIIPIFLCDSKYGAAFSSNI
jgi:hypothetical protein